MGLPKRAYIPPDYGVDPPIVVMVLDDASIIMRYTSWGDP